MASMDERRGLESYRDLAARLHLTEDAVRMRLHRLKRQFGQVLREVVWTRLRTNRMWTRSCGICGQYGIEVNSRETSTRKIVKE